MAPGTTDTVSRHPKVPPVDYRAEYPIFHTATQTATGVKIWPLQIYITSSICARSDCLLYNVTYARGSIQR
jgi:hypothetical protein